MADPGEGAIRPWPLWRNATLEDVKRSMTRKKGIKKFSVIGEILLVNAIFGGKYFKKFHSKMSKIWPIRVSEVLDALVIGSTHKRFISELILANNTANDFNHKLTRVMSHLLDRFSLHSEISLLFETYPSSP